MMQAVQEVRRAALQYCRRPAGLLLLLREEAWTPVFFQRFNCRGPMFTRSHVPPPPLRPAPTHTPHYNPPGSVGAESGGPEVQLVGAIK